MKTRHPLRWHVNAKTAAILLSVAGLLAGCIPQRIIEGQDRKHYLEYRTNAERLNFEREKAGLPPQPILTPEEWRHQ